MGDPSAFEEGDNILLAKQVKKKKKRVVIDESSMLDNLGND